MAISATETPFPLRSSLLASSDTMTAPSPPTPPISSTLPVRSMLDVLPLPKQQPQQSAKVQSLDLLGVSMASKGFIIGLDESYQECPTVLEEDEETASETHEAITPNSIDEPMPVFTIDQFDKSLQGKLISQLSSPAPLLIPPISGTLTPKDLPKPSPAKRANTFTRLFHRSSSNTNVSRLDVPQAENRPLTATRPLTGSKRSRSGFFTTNNSPTPSQSVTPKRQSPTNSSQEPTTPTKVESTGHGMGRLGRSRRSSSMTGLESIGEPENLFSMHAAEGVGLKARRLSTLAPTVHLPVIQLSSKYCSKSHMPLRSKQVGVGATAIVKLMIKINGNANELYAVKEFRKKSSSETEAEYNQKLNSEFCLSRSLHHSNVVVTEDLCRSNSGRWCHVMEYCSGGDLYNLIQKKFMGTEEKLCCFKQLLRGVAYLHSHGIAHRDIKPENLLVASDGHLKITDFGISEVFSGKHPGLAGMKCGVDMNQEIKLSRPGISGSRPYLSPEVLLKNEAYDSRKLDVWSCAIVYFTLHYGGFPWNEATPLDPNYSNYSKAFSYWLEKNPDGLITSEGKVPGARVLSDFPPQLRRMLYRMAHPDPEKRILISEALNDRWMDKSVECCVLNHDFDHAAGSMDTSKASSCGKAGKLGVKKLHIHLPLKSKSNAFGIYMPTES